MLTLCWIAFILAAIPCLLTLWNLALYPVPPRRPRDATAPPPAVSVLIPARDEAANIRAAVEAVLANQGVEFEVIVLDDHSTDATARIVQELAQRDARVRLETAPPLPADWGGKPHACHVLAGLARHAHLLFLDADVRLAPDALGRLVSAIEAGDLGLLSGIPRQLTGSWLERLLIPLIHFVLLGYLPFVGMRRFRHPMFAAGCGQLFLARREAYRQAGGHAAIRRTWHDGLKLPRAFRRAGWRTGLVDLTELASCRMYSDAGAVWRGLAKNATEGMASPGTIGPMSLLLFGGQVLPFLLLPGAVGSGTGAVELALGAAGCVWLPRWIEAWRFRLPWLSAWLHPVGVAVFLVIQWTALVQGRRGRATTWKGRTATALLAVTLSLTLGGTPILAQAVPASPSPAVVGSLPKAKGFVLPDQYKRTHTFAFPRTNAVLLTVADKKGSEQIEGWVKPVRERFGPRIDVAGIADVAKAPGPIRGLIRKAFRDQCPYPVMLDWEGTTARGFGYAKGRVSVLLIDRDGTILRRHSGEVSPTELGSLLAEIERLVRAPATVTPAATESCPAPGTR